MILWESSLANPDAWSSMSAWHQLKLEGFFVSNVLWPNTNNIKYLVCSLDDKYKRLQLPDKYNLTTSTKDCNYMISTIT